MVSGFRLDCDSKEFERQVMKAAERGVRGLAREYEQMFDSLRRRYTGRPVAEIKPVLTRAWARIGGSIPDPELTDYASLISEGRRIKMQVKM